MKETLTVILISDGGDSPDTWIWYINALKEHYKGKVHINTLIFKHDGSEEALRQGVVLSTQLAVRDFIQKNNFETAEIHAQGGLGAFVAYEFLRYCELQNDSEHYGRKVTLTNVFMVGGAPSDAMTWVARWFHQDFSRFWYRIQWLKPFFADDPPNPECDETIKKIRDLSTKAMRDNPKLYRNQLMLIGSWRIPEDWRVAEGCKVWYVPNGETMRFQPKEERYNGLPEIVFRCSVRIQRALSRMWDNTYDDAKAKACWESHGVQVTAQPGKNFSFYSMMPVSELLIVMDEVRKVVE